MPDAFVDAPPAEAGTEEVSVLIVDDSGVIRHGLRALLGATALLRVVGEASNGQQALALARELRPDVVLLDVKLGPPPDGVEVARELSGSARVLMLTFSDEPATIREALAAGAAGYLVHGHFDAADLAASVLGAARGTAVFSPQVVAELRSSLAAAPAPLARQSGHGLTDRELEIMDLIAAGLTNTEIAARSYLAVKTVRNHVNHIFAKLHVTTRAEAVSLWLGGRSGPDS
ncbi:MAG TPA: response regulator transcription factor [Acidimicrobiales bacterium]|nr:response regulator transcription factor [Acidimicrobiales bacterium]